MNHCFICLSKYFLQKRATNEEWEIQIFRDRIEPTTSQLSIIIILLLQVVWPAAHIEQYRTQYVRFYYLRIKLEHPPWAYLYITNIKFKHTHHLYAIPPKISLTRQLWAEISWLYHCAISLHPALSVIWALLIWTMIKWTIIDTDLCVKVWTYL